MRYLLKRGLALLTALLVISAACVYAAPDIIPVSEIKPGMKGIAKTVVSGTKIEEFGVEVIGIMKNKGPSGDLILVRTYGDLIDKTGGIAQGMSGSPVYINGKLAGAVAYGWSLTDHKIGMLTPIEDMLKLWELPDRKNVFSTNDSQTEDNKELKPVATPLMVSGFGQQALAMLKDKLQPLNLIPYAAGDAPAGTTFGPLEPGSAVGVQLAAGDVSIGALGTVTYVEGDKVLAFGHPFLKKGNVNYLMTNAYVFTTVNSLENSFKVGATGDIIGLINQDRGAAVAGRTGLFPSVVPIKITVTDNVLNRTEVAGVHVVQDEQLAPILAATTVFNFIEKTMDRVGQGTAHVSFAITGRDLPVDVLHRENMFYSSANIGQLAVGEFFDAMTFLAGNQYHPVDIMDVKVNVTIDEERKTATIVEAHANAAKAKPGDKIDITVKLKPYRGEVITRVVPYTIPKEQQAGPLMLEVRGGGMIPLTELLLKKQGIDDTILKNNKKKNQAFADAIKEFINNDRNNDIVVEPMSSGNDEYGNTAEIDKSAANKPQKPVTHGTAADKVKGGNTPAGIENKKADDNKAKTHLTTDYIIDGDTQVLVEIDSKK